MRRALLIALWLGACTVDRRIPSGLRGTADGARVVDAGIDAAGAERPDAAGAPDGPVTECLETDRRCGSGTTPQICTGGKWVSETACPFTCTGNGQCAGECMPSARVCDGQSARKICGPDFLYKRETCPGLDNGVATCTAGECGTACNSHFHRCGSESRCAADDDPQNCGSSCKPCGTLGGGTFACTAGQCVAHCQAVTDRPCGAACEPTRTMDITPIDQTCKSGGQLCERLPIGSVNVTGCARTLEVHLTMAPTHCAKVIVEVFANGASKGSMGPLDRSEAGAVALGKFAAGTAVNVAVQAMGVLGGCDNGSLGGWQATGGIDVLVAP
jgi:hypothetical protein